MPKKKISAKTAAAAKTNKNSKIILLEWTGVQKRVIYNCFGFVCIIYLNTLLKTSPALGPLFRRVAKKLATLASKSSGPTAAASLVLVLIVMPARMFALTRRTARIAASFTINSSSAPLNPSVTAATALRSTLPSFLVPNELERSESIPDPSPGYAASWPM